MTPRTEATQDEVDAAVRIFISTSGLLEKLIRLILNNFLRTLSESESEPVCVCGHPRSQHGIMNARRCACLTFLDNPARCCPCDRYQAAADSQHAPARERVPLSSRVRPDCEAAPWVIEEIKKMETKLGHHGGWLSASEMKRAEQVFDSVMTHHHRDPYRVRIALEAVIRDYLKA